MLHIKYIFCNEIMYNKWGKNIWEVYYEKLIKKKEYYLKEKARLETVLNKHIPNRLAEIDEILDILNKNNFQVNTVDNSDIDYEYYNDDFSTYQSKIAEDTPTYIPE